LDVFGKENVDISDALILAAALLLFASIMRGLFTMFYNYAGESIGQHIGYELRLLYYQKLQKLYEIPIVGDVRGMGLMAGIECVIDKDSKNPLVLDKAIASRIDEESLKLGLIIRPIYHICVLSPALIIQKNQIDELVDKLFQAIVNATAQLEAEGLWSK